MSSPSEDLYNNMTEVLFPAQSYDPRQSDSHQVIPTTDWFIPPTYQSTTRIVPSQSHSTSSHPLWQPPPTPPSSANFRQSPFLPSAVSSELPHSITPALSSGRSNSIPQVTLFSDAGAPASAKPSLTPRSTTFAPIAPDPVGLQRIQASQQSRESEGVSTDRSKKRRLTAGSMEAPPPPQLKDDDKLLIHLKEDRGLPWRDIASRFQQETGKVHMIPALQMRYRRLKERLQVWSQQDIEALRQAHTYWEERKFDIISTKMIECGASEKFSARACAKKWQELHPTADYLQPLSLVPSNFSSMSPPPRAGSYSSASTTFNPSLPPGPMYSSQAPQPAYGSAPQSSYSSGTPHQSYPPTAPTSYGSATASQSSTAYQAAPVAQSPAMGGYRQSPQPQPGSAYSQSPQSRLPNYPPGSHGGMYWG